MKKGEPRLLNGEMRDSDEDDNDLELSLPAVKSYMSLKRG